MKRRSFVPAAATGIVLTAAASAAALGLARAAWRRETRRAVDRLDGFPASPPPVVVATYLPEQLAGLPAPVVRYFEYALRPGQPLVRRARLEQRGELRMGPGENGWRPFTATEHFAVAPPGFFWDARVRMAPLVTAHVRDGYARGVGTMQARVAALVPVADQQGTPELASSSLMRYLAEAAWVPTALLPAAGITWAPLDDRTARATLADGTTSVSVDVHFSAGGEIERVTALRYRDVNGTPVLTPMDGRFGEYHRVAGMMIPRRGEMTWVLPEGPLPSWRGRIVAAEYETTKR